jgi:hypothetical protein
MRSGVYTSGVASHKAQGSEQYRTGARTRLSFMKSFCAVSAVLCKRSALLHRIAYLSVCLAQWFSTFMRPRPINFSFIRRGPSPNEFTRKHISSFVKVHALS